MFSNHVPTLPARIVANTSETESHAELRDTLLPKLMAGDIRVNDADEILEVEDDRKS